MRSSVAVLLILVFALWAAAQAQTLAVQSADRDSAPPQVQITKGPTVEHLGSHDAIIAWSTNVSAGTFVRYGTDPNKLDQTAEMPWGGFTHRVTIKNLRPGTTYYFQAESGQAQGTGTTALSHVDQIHTPDEGLPAATTKPTTKQ